MITWNKDRIEEHHEEEVLIKVDMSFLLGRYDKGRDEFRADGEYYFSAEQIEKFATLESDNDTVEQR